MSTGITEGCSNDNIHVNLQHSHFFLPIIPKIKQESVIQAPNQTDYVISMKNPNKNLILKNNLTQKVERR